MWVSHWPVFSAAAVADERAACRQIERIHLANGWFGAGYNWAIGQSGSIFELAGLMVRGVHAGNFNTQGFGICFLQPSTPAGVPTAPMTPAMRNSARALYEWLCSRTGRRLQMTWHGALMATACPGPDVRAFTQGGMQAQVPPPIPEDAVSVSAVMRNDVLNVFFMREGDRRVWVVWQNRDGSWAGPNIVPGTA